MQLPLSLIRIIFIALAISLCTAIAFIQAGTLNSILIGIGSGLALSACLIAIDFSTKKMGLKSFNIITLGLFFGYFLGDAVVKMLGAIIEVNLNEAHSFSLLLIRAAIFFMTCYAGIIITARSAGELYFSIPFIKFTPSSYKKKDLLVDSSALSDSRLLDLATTGLLDQQLIIPRCLTKELHEHIDSQDDSMRMKARRSLDAIKKLEAMVSLEMRYTDIDCPDVKEPVTKILKLGSLLDANILSTDIPRSQQINGSGPLIVNINTLSRALKPLSQTGELLSIKIQRYGKEPRQGVGYLEDGTMVVVNGGAQFIGSTIKTQVLSAKLTTSGRMIFCNALGNDSENDHLIGTSVSDVDNLASNYFSH